METLALALFVAAVTHPLFILGFLGVAGLAVSLGTLNPYNLGQILVLLGPSLVTNTSAASFTITAGQMTGSLDVYFLMSGAPSGGITATSRTAAQLYADIAALLGFNPPAGYSFRFTINNQAGQTVTLAGGTGVTVSGTATVASTDSRTWAVVVNSATSVTITNVSSGTD